MRYLIFIIFLSYITITTFTFGISLDLNQNLNLKSPCINYFSFALAYTPTNINGLQKKDINATRLAAKNLKNHIDNLRNNGELPHHKTQIYRYDYPKCIALYKIPDKIPAGTRKKEAVLTAVAATNFCHLELLQSLKNQEQQKDLMNELKHWDHDPDLMDTFKDWDGSPLQNKHI